MMYCLIAIFANVTPNDSIKVLFEHQIPSLVKSVESALTTLLVIPSDNELSLQISVIGVTVVVKQPTINLPKEGWVIVCFAESDVSFGPILC